MQNYPLTNGSGIQDGKWKIDTEYPSSGPIYQMTLSQPASRDLDLVDHQLTVSFDVTEYVDDYPFVLELISVQVTGQNIQSGTTGIEPRERATWSFLSI